MSVNVQVNIPCVHTEDWRETRLKCFTLASRREWVPLPWFPCGLNPAKPIQLCMFPFMSIIITHLLPTTKLMANSSYSRSLPTNPFLLIIPKTLTRLQPSIQQWRAARHWRWPMVAFGSFNDTHLPPSTISGLCIPPVFNFEEWNSHLLALRRQQWCLCFYFWRRDTDVHDFESYNHDSGFRDPTSSLMFVFIIPICASFTSLFVYFFLIFFSTLMGYHCSVVSKSSWAFKLFFSHFLLPWSITKEYIPFYGGAVYRHYLNMLDETAIWTQSTGAGFEVDMLIFIFPGDLTWTLLLLKWHHVYKLDRVCVC